MEGDILITLPAKTNCSQKVVFLLAFLLIGYAAAAPARQMADPAIRNARVEQLGRISRGQKAQAVAIARRQGFPSRRQVGHTIFQLIRIDDSRVYEYKTLNANAAITIGATPLYWAPYGLDGSGQRIGIWDGGAVLASHQEFDGRVTLMETASAITHATHVAGTLIAAGFTASAKGMSPAAYADSYEFNDDLSEMTARAMSAPGQSGMLQISNHSYGYVTGWNYVDSKYSWYGTWVGAGPNLECDMFGQYSDDARDWDDLCYDAPYYLPFKAAGNDRSDAAPAAGASFQYWYLGTWRTTTYNSTIHPRADGWDQGGHDTISTVDTAKNIMLVGAVTDAVSGGQRSVTSAQMTSFSCWGPTDDGRVKPDIVANGSSLYSASSTSNTAYATNTGTSMSTPNACGGAGLLLQHHSDLFAGQYMRASTLKALILHTADELGNPGPDYRFGFGLMNVNAAVDLLNSAREWSSRDIVMEDVLTTSVQSQSYPLAYDGTGPIKVTLCWTDPAGTAQTGLDNSTRALVNDLDLRLISPDGLDIYYPYVLDPANPTAAATTGDNVLDNVEQIYIPFVPQTGTYTITVGFKAPLTNAAQHYSLIVTGQSLTEIPPQAFDVIAQTTLDTPALIALDATDDGHPIPPARLTYTIHSLPNHGTLADPNGDPNMPITALPYNLAGYGRHVLYTPRPSCDAPAVFSYAANDSGIAPDGGESNIATVNIEILRPGTIYSADMTVDPAWTLEGQWQWGIPAGLGGSTGNADPSSGYTGAAVIGYNLDGDYANRIDQTQWATLGPLNCLAFSDVTLTFRQWLNIDQGASDKVYLELSTDNVHWTTLWANSTAVIDSDWNMRTLSLPAADHQPSVYLRWGLGPTNNTKAYSGWNLDDVLVTGLAPSGSLTPGDFEPDCDVDFEDLWVLVYHWLETCGDCGPADITADGIVSLEDFTIMARYWLTEP